MTLSFMIAASNRLPCSTVKPAFSLSGRENGRITSVSRILACRYTARPVIVLAKVLAGRLQVHEQRDVLAVCLPVGERQLDADVSSERIEMDRSVRGPPDRGVDAA